MTCGTCGHDLAVGDWPFCPHGRPHWVVSGDEIPGGFVQENFGPTPEVFYSKREMARRAKELGLEPMVRNAGPLDKHVPRWVSVDLDAAKAAVERM